MNNFKTKSLEDISLKNDAKQVVSKDQMVTWVIERIRTSIPNPESLKYNPELVVYISSCIEISCAENGLRVDKLECLIEIYKSLFELSTQDEIIIIQMTNFIHKNKLIKTKISDIVKVLKKCFIYLIPQFLS